MLWLSTWERWEESKEGRREACQEESDLVFFVIVVNVDWKTWLGRLEMDTQLKTVNYKLDKILRDIHPNQICSIDREFELVFLLFLLILTMPILDMMAKKGTVWVCHCLRGRLNRPTKDHPPLMSPSPSPSSPATPQQHHRHQNHHRPCWSSQWTMRDASLNGVSKTYNNGN